MSRVWSWRQAIWESSLGATTKIILQALASHLNDMGEPMFPSQARLSRMCSLSERAVIAHLHIAEQAGWIAPRKRDLKGSKWAANEYVATWPDGVNDVHAWGEPRSCGGVNDVHTNSPVLTSKEHTARACMFEGFWTVYPRQIARGLCITIWKRRKLDDHAEDVIAAVKAWSRCEQWRRGIIPNPSTFLNQERWKDTPPAGEQKPLAKGGVRVRETTTAEDAAAKARNEFLRLNKLPENLNKTPDEIRAMIQTNEKLDA